MSIARIPSDHPPSGRPAFDRRMFLAGLGAAAALAACGGSDDGSDAAGDDGAPDLEPGTFSLVQRFPTTVLVPGEVRLPHGLVRDAEFVNDGPDRLGAQVVDLDGNPIGERMIAERFDVTPSAYYVWRPTIEEVGIYGLVVDGGPAEGAAFQVVDPASVVVPGAGDALPAFDTPTETDGRGVDPICTRDPICPFHAATLTDALADGRSVAYLVGTPAFCRTGTCAPALEAMIEVAPEFEDDLVVVHAEVYTDLTAQELTPAIEQLGMSFEPALFIAGPDGAIVERIDAIWGADELRQRLSAAIS